MTVAHRSRDAGTDHKCLNVKCGTFDQKTNKMEKKTMYIIIISSLNFSHFDCDFVLLCLFNFTTFLYPLFTFGCAYYKV